MIDKLIIGKLKSLLVLETEQDGEIKTLLLPKGVILELRLSSDYDHELSGDAMKEIEEFITGEGMRITNFYYPN